MCRKSLMGPEPYLASVPVLWAYVPVPSACQKPAIQLISSLWESISEGQNRLNTESTHVKHHTSSELTWFICINHVPLMLPSCVKHNMDAVKQSATSINLVQSIPISPGPVPVPRTPKTNKSDLRGSSDSNNLKENYRKVNRI